uniref:Rho GTPase activating protein 4a n=1 Tax=Gadus morhua TaxID=8049 RepID=A0A8C4Z858_GADMO
MSSHVKLRKDRVGVVTYDTQIKEVRSQLVDQLKVLDLQLEHKSQQMQDLSEYLRRRGEIEGDYARSLERLAEKFTSKIKRKEPSGQSVAQVWRSLLAQTRQEARDHSGLSESCSNLLIQPLANCLEYTQRLSRKVQHRLLVCTCLDYLEEAWRTYLQYYSDFMLADGKLRDAEKQEEKQKTKKMERLIEKRQGKVQEIQVKCSKARNEYLLNLAAANASMNKYYLQDISTLIDCADTGYHQTVGRVMRSYLSRWNHAQKNQSTGLQQIQGTVSGLVQNMDRDNLLETHNNTFCLPLRFQYQPHDGDQVCEVSTEHELSTELETRFKQIQNRLTTVCQETEEAGKGLMVGHSSLLEIVSDDDLEPRVGGGTGCPQEEGAENQASKPSAARRRANQQEIEQLYLTKVKEYLLGSSLASKLQAKHDLLKVAVEKGTRHPSIHTSNNQLFIIMTHHGCCFNTRICQKHINVFFKASGQEIPEVVESCIRFINLKGLHHEGIFRVPGLQAEIISLRDAFERGEDPLTDQPVDMDSVAGVLKLYFRTLKNPLFPLESTSQLLEAFRNETEGVAHLKLVISAYPAPLVVVMRYLFAFLNHLSQYSDENMMQPYNLAVCFGPSLLRGAPDEDVVTLQPQINALVKSIILQHEGVFPSQAEVQGPVYEKCMTLEQDDCEPILEDGDGDAECLQGKGDLILQVF